MNKLTQQLEKAKKSKSALWKLNFFLSKFIPFNRPHKIKISEITDDGISVEIPYFKRNLNHIKGVHACGLATAAEYCSGLVLLNRLDSAKYRLIMKSLQVEYLYQAKSDVTCHYSISNKELAEKIISPLIEKESVFYTCVINAHDKNKNHICTVKTQWQIKPWSKVKTKLA